MFSYITAQYLFHPQEQQLKCIRKNAGIIGVPDLARAILPLVKVLVAKNRLLRVYSLRGYVPIYFLTYWHEHEKRKPLTVSEDFAIYKEGDPDLAEILKWLRENPKDKKLILKLIQGRRITKEAIEGFGGGDILEEGGRGKGDCILSASV